MTVVELSPFTEWLANLRDDRARKRIVQRLVRLRAGSKGDYKGVGAQVSELRIDIGPGYRVYFSQRGDTFLLLLCGGDKASQRRDILRAQAILSDWLKDQE